MKIRAVLDTNVLVSGILGFGRVTTPPAVIYERWYRQEYELIVSHHILAELRRTLINSYFIARIATEQRETAIETILEYASIEDVSGPVPIIATHPEDDLILATAISADVDYLVTGDRQLLALGHIDRMAIVRAGEFIAILDAAKP